MTPPAAAWPDPAEVLSVSELNAEVRGLIEGTLPLLWVRGEISNFVRAASGHCYFSLKDPEAQVRCVLFRQRAQLIGLPLANGTEVDVRAAPGFYEPRGEFQLNVEFVRLAGVGSLFAAFERLKRKLGDEGLFEASRKRPLPPLPRTVGIVTSPSAAALRDVVTTLRARMPAVRVVLYPALVQGAEAPRSLVAALDTAAARREVEILIVCRGGGSLEDLWAFNDEAVARALARSPVPVISGVGHETDFTIADFVADLRAPTPTAAAMAAVPEAAELQRRLERLRTALVSTMRRSAERRAQQLDLAAGKLRHPGERLAAQRERLSHLAFRARSAWRAARLERAERLRSAQARLRAAGVDPRTLSVQVRECDSRLRRAWEMRLQALAARLEQCAGGLAHLDPEAVLQRGYAIVRASDGSIVREAASLHVQDRVAIAFGRGRATAAIDAVEPD